MTSCFIVSRGLWYMYVAVNLAGFSPISYQQVYGSVFEGLIRMLSAVHSGLFDLCNIFQQ